MTVLSGILSVVLLNPVVGTTTLGHPESTVRLEVTRINQKGGIIYGYLRLVDGSTIFSCPTHENALYAIRPGVYVTSLQYSGKRKRLVPFLEVPGRSDIEIHSSGNPLLLKGCIGVSKRNFDALIKLLPQHLVVSVAAGQPSASA